METLTLQKPSVYGPILGLIRCFHLIHTVDRIFPILFLLLTATLVSVLLQMSPSLDLIGIPLLVDALIVIEAGEAHSYEAVFYRVDQDCHQVEHCVQWFTVVK